MEKKTRLRKYNAEKSASEASRTNIDLHGSDDALGRNVNGNVRTVFCIIEIAEVVSSLAERVYNP